LTHFPKRLPCKEHQTEIQRLSSGSFAKARD